MNNVVIKSRVQAFNIDAYNRTAVCAGTDLENGSVFVLDSYSTAADEGMVWVANAPAATTAAGLWMATSPEVVITKLDNGEVFKGLTPDPRAFKNLKGYMIDATKLCAGDIIEMTGANITDIGTEDYLVANAGAYNLVAANAATAANAGFAMKKLGTSKLHIGGANGAIVPTAVTTYKFEVVKN